LLGTSIARSADSRRSRSSSPRSSVPTRCPMARTGKGNDQVRYELAYYALKPDITIIAPWRRMGPAFARTTDRICRDASDSDRQDKRGEAPFSVDANLLHASSEGKVLEEPRPWKCPTMSIRAPSIRKRAPDKRPLSPSISRRAMRPRSTARNCRPRRCWRSLTNSATPTASGRLDLAKIVSSGMKSRACTKTPGGTILLAAHRGIESITLDRGAAASQGRALMPKYAELVYNGFWFAPEREMLQAAIESQPGLCHRARAASNSTRATSS